MSAQDMLDFLVNAKAEASERGFDFNDMYVIIDVNGYHYTFPELDSPEGAETTYVEQPPNIKYAEVILGKFSTGTEDKAPGEGTRKIL
jgi:hypothetical protein